MDNILMVTTTFSSRNDAEDIAMQLLQKKLAACIQISQKIQSYYWWESNIEKSDEYIMTIKTREKIYPHLERFLKEIHPYETPEILAVRAIHADRDYRQWLVAETPEL